MSSYQTQLHHGARTGDESQLRSALLDSVTHDLRSPLTSIKAAVTALLADSRVGPSQRHELLSVINEEAERLNRLVGNAVEVSRLDAQVRLELRAHTVAAIVDAAKEDCRSLLASRLLSVQLPPDLPTVRVDLQRVKQALIQLLENAVKYSPSNEPISITASVSGKLVTISVADRGRGIDDSEQKLIFERFYRGKNHRRVVQGTGMGLHIANAIIKAHGGSLRVTSRHGHGCTFLLTLPVYRTALGPA